MRNVKVFSIILAVVIIAIIIIAVCSVVIPKRKSIVSENAPEADSTLVLSHILFRHGNRVPNPQYSNNPYNDESLYPEGFGQLSEDGKKVAFRMGRTLKDRYKWFLGPTWYYRDILARSTDGDRTKMSLQILLAALWPPTGIQVIDSSLNWQPIPYNLNNKDQELEADKICTNFNTMKSEVENSPEIQEALSAYKPYWEYFSNMSGDNITTLQNVFDLCVDSLAQRAYGYPLEDWVSESLPIIEKMARDIYYIETNTTELKKLVAGYLLKKMITDSKSKIDGVLTRGKKMNIYSAHEKNIAYFLRTLDIYDDKVPTFGTHVLVELHLVDGVYGFKIYHQDWSTNEPQLKAIPGCQTFCPYDEFVSLTQELIIIIPEDDFCILKP